MNNQQIIDQRWANTEKSYRSKLKDIRELYEQIGDELVEAVSYLGINFDNLNKLVPDNVRRQIKRKIEAWQDEGIVTGYFAYLVTSLTRYTYYNVLQILVFGLYLSKNRKINRLCNRIIKAAAQDCYDQGRKDLKLDPKELSWEAIEPLTLITDLNLKFKDYLRALNETAAEEMFKQLIVLIRLKAEITATGIYTYLLKQANRILNINRDKMSGVLVDVSRAAGNKAYVQADDGKDQLIKFVAEMDDRTTDMCISLNGQLFHTHDWNRFTRYSAYYKGLHTFSWYGLEQGLNMPPINDHFHWCRSTMTYQVD